MAVGPQTARCSPPPSAMGQVCAAFPRALLRSLVAVLVTTGIGTFGFGEDEPQSKPRKSRQAPIRVSSERSPVPRAGRVVQAGGRRDDSEKPFRKAKLYDDG